MGAVLAEIIPFEPARSCLKGKQTFLRLIRSHFGSVFYCVYYVANRRSIYGRINKCNVYLVVDKDENEDNIYIEYFKPYLFPLSSMTEEKKQEYELTTIKDGIMTVWTTETYDCLNKHHIDYINQAHYKRDIPYEETEPNQIVVDYIASMTDDYMIDLYSHLLIYMHRYFLQAQGRKALRTEPLPPLLCCFQ